MILRFRGKDGSYRVNADSDWFFSDVIHDLERQLPPFEGAIAVSSAPNVEGEIATSKWDQSLSDLGLKHGDMLFITYKTVVEPSSETIPAAKEDPVDVELNAQTGRISRDQTHLCTHGANGMCEYCQPLEPYDSDYQSEHKIKHLSIHAYRKKVQEEGGFLEMPDFKVKQNCRNGHKPWPQGYCSSCQPSTITLQQQKFRMVDHVEFMSPKLIEQFIEYWRSSNQQRIGFLVGKYLPYDRVPLGIKAQVHAIWEPHQNDDVDSLLLEQLPSEEVKQACKMLGLEILGLVFTDLVDLGDRTGKVLAKRHEKSYFLTSLEVKLTAKLQNDNKHNLLGTEFSSRFVTCCVSGNLDGDIDVACYQASVQAEALASADLIVASTNPSVMRFKAASKSRFVPEAFYKRINEYKATVLQDAKPAFPVDYLLVSLSHGFRTNTEDLVLADLPSFTIENRKQMKAQTQSQLADKLNLLGEPNFAMCLDFHLLLYLLSLHILNDEEMKLLTLLVEGLQTADSSADGMKLDLLGQELANGPGMSTLKMLI